MMLESVQFGSIQFFVRICSNLSDGNNGYLDLKFTKSIFKETDNKLDMSKSRADKKYLTEIDLGTIKANTEMAIPKSDRSGMTYDTKVAYTNKLYVIFYKRCHFARLFLPFSFMLPFLIFLLIN